MISSSFSYMVTIVGDNEFLKNSEFAKFFPDANSAIIESNLFDDFDICLEKMTLILNLIASEMSQVSSTNYILISVPNPQYFDEDAVSDEVWPAGVIFRTYIADAKLFQNNILKYSASADISII